MRIFILFFLSFLILTSKKTFGQWSNHIGTSHSSDYSNSVATNDSGDVYITGLFSGDEIFVAKIQSDGSIGWFKNFDNINGFGYNKGNAIITDNSGRCYVTGKFKGTITFDSITLSTNSGDDIFIVCFSPIGDVLWAKQAGGGYDDSGQGLAIDNFGNLFITGNYNGDISGPATFGATSITGEGAFIAKYDSTGNFHWVQAIQSTSSNSIALDNQGNIFITGTFNAAISLGQNTLFPSGFSDIIIAKFDNNGNALWANKAGGNASLYDENCNGVSTDSFGNCYITGTYSGSASFGNYTVNSIGNTDIFIAKYDLNGNPQWVKSAGGSDYDYSNAITTDANGNSYITGQVRDSTYFGSIIIQKGLFVARYDINGVLQNITSAYSSGFSGIWGNDICLDKNNNCYVSGGFDGTANLDINITTYGVQDIFTWKIGQVLDVVEPANKSDVVSIFPNPFSTQLTIKTSRILKDATFRMYNSFGQDVKQVVSISGNTINLHRDKLPSGVYYFQITEENKLINSGKVLIVD